MGNNQELLAGLPLTSSGKLAQNVDFILQVGNTSVPITVMADEVNDSIASLGTGSNSLVGVLQTALNTQLSQYFPANSIPTITVSLVGGNIKFTARQACFRHRSEADGQLPDAG
ncbi:MAG: hypothetical protein QM703_07315 [Gemmatales bacterium]